VVFYNGRPNKNIRYVPNIRYILDRLEKQERLAISPELNKNMEAEMCERCMKTKEEQAIWDKEHDVQGDQELFEELGKQDPHEIYKDDLDGIEVGPRCPACNLNTQFHNGVETCPIHGPVVIED